MRTFLKASSDERPDADAIRERRIEIARRHTGWTELREADLVPRPRAYLVHADKDWIFTRVSGTVFAMGSATVVAEHPAYYFYVGQDGELVFLERQPGTWSELVEKRERRRLSRL